MKPPLSEPHGDSGSLSPQKKRRAAAIIALGLGGLFFILSLAMLVLSPQFHRVAGVWMGDDVAVDVASLFILFMCLSVAIGFVAARWDRKEE